MYRFRSVPDTSSAAAKLTYKRNFRGSELTGETLTIVVLAIGLAATAFSGMFAFERFFLSRMERKFDEAHEEFRTVLEEAAVLWSDCMPMPTMWSISRLRWPESGGEAAARAVGARSQLHRR